MREAITDESSEMASQSDATVATAHVSAGYVRVKAVIDWIMSLALLILMAPMLACLAIVLKLTSDGPVLYSQERLGRFGKVFRVYKLRTMVNKCEATTGPVWSIADDPRVTRVGRWLRDTHLDEIPQLWNVLRGEMSLIGPRPERPELAEKIERWLPEFRHRLQVRPGITGLAQMRLPADSNLNTVREKLAYDRRYIQRLGPTLDVMIIVSTVLHMIGCVASMVSRRLVAPYAPLPAIDEAAVLPDLDLTLAAHPVGRLHLAPEDDAEILWEAA
jgi:lipopolysaccharide/colanic/teichoic acid biosynthesis glycosyltransferase